MKRFYGTLILFLCAVIFAALDAQNTASAADIINLPTETLKGKFYSIEEGFIVLEQKGVKKSYVRLDRQNDIYRDYIVYSTFPFLGSRESTPCKVIFLDDWVVKFKLPNTNTVEIPRYRIKDLEININE